VALSDAFVTYYRREPGFRQLWFATGFNRCHGLDIEHNRRLRSAHVRPPPDP